MGPSHPSYSASVDILGECLLLLNFLFFRIDLAHDVFGRERHRLHKEDMGGVGTFDKECRTLYVGGLALRTKLEKLLWSEFGEWGEIEVSIVGEEMDVSVHLHRDLFPPFSCVVQSEWSLTGPVLYEEFSQRACKREDEEIKNDNFLASTSLFSCYLSC